MKLVHPNNTGQNPLKRDSTFVTTAFNHEMTPKVTIENFSPAARAL